MSAGLIGLSLIDLIDLTVIEMLVAGLADPNQDVGEIFRMELKVVRDFQGSFGIFWDLLGSLQGFLGILRDFSRFLSLLGGFFMDISGFFD